MQLLFLISQVDSSTTKPFKKCCIYCVITVEGYMMQDFVSLELLSSVFQLPDYAVVHLYEDHLK